MFCKVCATEEIIDNEASLYYVKKLMLGRMNGEWLKLVAGLCLIRAVGTGSGGMCTDGAANSEENNLIPFTDTFSFHIFVIRLSYSVGLLNT